MGKSDADRVAVWASFLHAHSALMTQLERELVAERGITLPWYDVLLQLYQADGELRMQELAGAVLLSKSGLTRLVDRMETAGLVARRACPSDRRGTLVGLTSQGRETFRRAAPVHRRGIREHFTDKLDEDDLGALARVLAKVMGPAPADEVGDCGAAAAEAEAVPTG